jgi:UrcA family protein
VNIIKSLILSTFVATCAVAVQAQAGTPDAPPSRKVSLADLNLNSPDGARAAYRRILVVARSLCGVADSTDWEIRAAYLKCVDSTVRDTVEKLNQREVTLYAESVGMIEAAKPGV